MNLSPQPIKVNRKFIQILDISQGCLSSSSAEAVAENLRWTPNLISLDLNGNHLQDYESVRKLLLAIKLLPNLKYLDLSNNFLGDKGVCVLSEALAVHGSLKYLKLNQVQMGFIGLSSLKIHLRNCSDLRELSLAGNFWSTHLLQFTQVLTPLSGWF